MSTTKYSNLILLLLIIFLLAEFRFFYLVSLPDIFSGSASNKFLVSIISILVFSIFIILNFLKSDRKFVIRIDIFFKNIITLLLIILFSGINSKLEHGYTMTNVIWFMVPFLILLMYFPLVRWLQYDIIYNKFLLLSKIVVGILCILFLFQSFIYNGGSTFLKLDGIISEYYTYGSGMRLYSVFEGYVRVLIIVIANEIICNDFKKSKFNLIIFFLMFFSIVVIDQSRYYILTILFSCLFVYMVHNNIVKHVKKMIFLLLLILLLLPIIFDKVYSIILSIEENTGSSYARISAIQYYIELMPKHFFWGLGITIPNEDSNLYKLILGPNEIYHYDDIGILGVFASLGIFGGIWYLLLIFKLLKIGITKLTNNSLAWGLIIGFCLAIPVMSYLDRPRISALLFMFVFIDLELKKTHS